MPRFIGARCGREQHAWRRCSGLLHLRRVAVVEQAVGGEVLVGRRRTGNLPLAGAGHPAGGVDDRRRRSRSARPRTSGRQRRATPPSGSSRARRRARRPASCVAVQLGQAVDEAREQLGRGVLLAVPLRVERRGPSAGSRRRGRRRGRPVPTQLGHDRAGCARAGSARNTRSRPATVGRRRGLEDEVAVGGGEARVQVGDRRARGGVAGDVHDVELGVQRQAGAAARRRCSPMPR